MSVGRISSYAMHQNTLQDASRVQLNLANEQAQLSSGLKAQDFAGLGGSESEQFLSLENKIAKTGVYVDNNNRVATRLNTTDNVLSQVIENLQNIKSLISQRRNGAANSDAFDGNLRAQWQSLTGLLNTNLEGRYLFSGTRTDSPAVDTENFPSLYSDGVPDDGYYRGSKEDVTVRADTNIEFVYNVRADDPAFQKVFAGMAMAKKGDSSNLDLDFERAYELIDQGLQGVISAQAVVNQNKVAIDNINQRHDIFKNYFKGIKETIGNADLVSVSTQVAINQGVLQAAFQAFAKINSLKLSDFLR